MTWPQLNTTSVDNSTSFDRRKKNCPRTHCCCCCCIGVFVVYIMNYSFANFYFTYSPEVLNHMDRWGSIATIGFSLECPRHPVILFLYLMQVQALQAQGNVQLGRQEKAYFKISLGESK